MEVQATITAFQADAFQFDVFQIGDEDYVGTPAKVMASGGAFARAKSNAAPVLNVSSGGAALGSAR